MAANLENYIDIILKEFKENATPREVLYTLLKRNMLDALQCRNFIILSEYPEAIRKNNFVRIDAAYDLALKHNLKLRQIQNIVGRYKLVKCNKNA